MFVLKKEDRYTIQNGFLSPLEGNNLITLKVDAKKIVKMNRLAIWQEIAIAWTA